MNEIPEHAVAIKRLRKERGWSAAALSERIGVLSRESIANIETGRRTYLTVDELLVFASAFGVTVDQIVPSLRPHIPGGDEIARMQHAIEAAKAALS